MAVKKALKYFILFALNCLMSTQLGAQELPAAPRDLSVTDGVLPNGMSYYLVSNPTTANIADFALVQKVGLNELGEQARTIARTSLSSLPRFQASPQEFLASHGVTPSRDGFVTVSENSTLYNFDNVITTESAIDSVLLVLMDIADRGTHSADSLWSWYAPENQAVIVSGDIDVDAVASKLKMLSYMIPCRPSRNAEDPIWLEREEAVCNILPGTSSQVATLVASWTSPRIPKEYMNTVQPAIFSMFINELGIVAKERISQKLRLENVPVAEVSYKHVSSLRTFADEEFVVSVSVAPEHVFKATEVLASTLASLDRGTVTVYELEMAKRRYLAGLEQRANRLMKSNSDYVEYCAAAFLYGAPLSSAKEIYPFLKYRSLSTETELGLFNNIASALLDGQKNLTLTCRSGDGQAFAKEMLLGAFASAWNSDNSVFETVESPDSLYFSFDVMPVKLKSSTKADPMSGGVVWTFENGFRVVYKRQPANNKMYYALALNGGYGNVRGLVKGEGAYVSDYLSLSDISHTPSRDFHLALEERGVTQNVTVNLSNTIISGYAPESELDLMMQSVLAFVNERGYDKEAFDYYKSCIKVEHELTKGSVSSRVVAIDSLMCPGYELSSFKSNEGLTEDFPEKVEAFWKHMSGKTNDGVLVLVGNIEETKLRKFLQNYILEFNTTDRSYARLNVSYQPVSGVTAYSFKGDENSVDVALSLRLPLTAENYMASNIVASILKQMLSKAISGTGMYLRLVNKFHIYPQERFNLMITLEEADSQGFAADVELAGADGALVILRNVLADLSNLEITDDDLVKHKDVLKGNLALKQADPQYWVQAIVMRYLDGKDFTTSYESRIDAITAEKVMSILTSLSSTSRIEYIIEK